MNELWDDTQQLLTDFIIWQQSQGLSPRTIDERLNTVRKFLKDEKTTPRSFTTKNIVRFCAKPHLSPASLQGYHSQLRAWCRWLVTARVRPDNPLHELKAPKRPKTIPRPLSLSEVQNLLATVNRHRTRIFILLGLYAGMRVFEIAKIRGEDIDFERNILTIKGKGGHTKQIPLHKELEQIAQLMPKAGYWFYPYTGEDQHIGYKAVSGAIKRVMERAGIANAKPHRLRHTYGTRLVESGADLRTIQILMRHECLNTTALYVATNWGAQKKALDNLSYG